MLLEEEDARVIRHPEGCRRGCGATTGGHRRVHRADCIAEWMSVWDKSVGGLEQSTNEFGARGQRSPNRQYTSMEPLTAFECTPLRQHVFQRVGAVCFARAQSLSKGFQRVRFHSVLRCRQGRQGGGERCAPPHVRRPASRQAGRPFLSVGRPLPSLFALSRAFPSHASRSL